MNLVTIYKNKEQFVRHKDIILDDWVYDSSAINILNRHEIDIEYFKQNYGSGVFDYFLGVASGAVEIGKCPVVEELIDYLKNKEIRAEELFVLCANFKKILITSTYDMGINSKELVNAISYLLDANFESVLKLYADTIYQKEQEALQASRAKEYFLSNMSHEIRTPLNAILGFVSLLQDESANHRQQRYLDIISSSGENLLQIINDILDFSKIRSGDFTIEPREFNIHKEISHTLELFVASANSKNIIMTSFIDPSIEDKIIADSLRIKQIISNFLSNAIKFSHRKSSIHIEAHAGDGVLSISVKDSGVGILEDDLASIFDPFSQSLQDSSNLANGTGLGLSICKQLAEHMGGTIELFSIYGEGSEFTLKVPYESVSKGCHLAQDSKIGSVRFGLLGYDNSDEYKIASLKRYWSYFGFDLEHIESIEANCDVVLFLDSSIDELRRESIIESRKPSIAIMDFLSDIYDGYDHIAAINFPIYCEKFYNALYDVLNQKLPPQKSKISKSFSGKVLVAEDNEANQELIAILLERYGLDFVMVGNGLDALEIFRDNRFDLVLMDEQMPIMNGNEAIVQMAKYEREHSLAHTPVAALTANVIKGHSEYLARYGYDAFLGKPVDTLELEELFSRYLNKKTALNIDSLKAILMLDSQQIERLLVAYKKKMNQLLLELRSAIDSADIVDISHIAHSIKGSSANFRFENLTNLSYRLERCGDIDESRELADMIEKEYKNLLL